MARSEKHNIIEPEWTGNIGNDDAKKAVWEYEGTKLARRKAKETSNNTSDRDRKPMIHIVPRKKNTSESEE